MLHRGHPCHIIYIFITNKQIFAGIFSSHQLLSVLSNQLSIRAATSTDFCNRLTGPLNSNHIRLTEWFTSPYGALCFHVFRGSDSPSGPSRLSWQVVSLMVSNQTSFMQIIWRSKIITCSVLMHKNKSLTWCHSPIVSSRIKVKNHITPICATNEVSAMLMLLLAVSYCTCPSQTCAVASAR